MADKVITLLASRRDVTLIVTGVGPGAGSRDPSLQVLYVLGVTPPVGSLPAARAGTGVVTLTDVTRTLVAFGQRGATTQADAVDGAPLEVRPRAVTVTGLQSHLRAVAALSDAMLVGYAAVGVGGASCSPSWSSAW